MPTRAFNSKFPYLMVFPTSKGTSEVYTIYTSESKHDPPPCNKGGARRKAMDQAEPPDDLGRHGGAASGDEAGKAARHYQLIEALMGRLQKMEAKASERLRACAADRDASTDLCSKLVPSLQQDLEERVSGSAGKPREASKFVGIPRFLKSGQYGRDGRSGEQ